MLIAAMWGTLYVLNPAVISVGAELEPIGLARIDITPDLPIRLNGYGNRKTEATEVAQKLWAKALVIGEDRGGDRPGPAILLMVENCGVPAAITSEVARRLEPSGVERVRFTIASTHTHTGPCLSHVLPWIFGTPFQPEERERIDRATRKLTDQLVEVVRAALADRQPGRLDWSVGKVGFAVNRRVLRDGQWTGFGENLDGPVDHSLPVLRVTRPDGTLRGLVINYACHCTTLTGDDNIISGDWAGAAQEALENTHPGATALITIGCGADANPRPRGKRDLAKQHGDAVAAEVDRLLKNGPWKPLSAPITTRLRTIQLPFQALPSRRQWVEKAKAPGAVGLQAQSMLQRLDRGESIPTTLPYTLQTWSFGDQLHMVFLAGEVVVDYAIRLKSLLPPDRLWVTAYANDAPCYIPSQRILREGGYEADSSLVYYDRPAKLAPAIEDEIINAVLGMMPKTSAMLPRTRIPVGSRAAR